MVRFSLRFNEYGSYAIGHKKEKKRGGRKNKRIGVCEQKRGPGGTVVGRVGFTQSSSEKGTRSLAGQMGASGQLVKSQDGQGGELDQRRRLPIITDPTSSFRVCNSALLREGEAS